MLRHPAAALLPAPPGAGASPRRVGKIARGGVVVSTALVACATCVLLGTTTHEYRVVQAKKILKMWGFSTGGSRQYEEVQYFGFNLFTSPGTQADGCFSEGANVSSCYLGNPTVKADLHHRAAIMLTAIRNAHGSEHVDHRDKVLKIFSAPEFYWRGPRGAYRLDSGMAETNRGVASEIMEELSKPIYKNWIFVLGTLVMAEKADPHTSVQKFGNRGNQSIHELTAHEKVVYHNFAPIHVGGSKTSYAEFKSYISGDDFLQGNAETDKQETFMPPPGAEWLTGTIPGGFCAEHPLSRGCAYGQVGHEVMQSLGLDHHRPLKKGVFEVGGVAIGLEICLDHRLGKLAEALDPARSVDVHLIVSEGMTIAMGPVCTSTGGPVFLADGAARTEMAMNSYGTGRRPVELPNGRIRYELGVAYGCDSLVAFQQWLGDIVVRFTGQSWGPRASGEGTLPGGSEVDGETGIRFHRMLALGENWKELIDGYYHVASYEKAQQVFNEIEKAEQRLKRSWQVEHDVEKPIIAPSIDIYGPLELVDTERLW